MAGRISGNDGAQRFEGVQGADEVEATGASSGRRSGRRTAGEKAGAAGMVSGRALSGGMGGDMLRQALERRAAEDAKRGGGVIGGAEALGKGSGRRTAGKAITDAAEAAGILKGGSGVRKAKGKSLADAAAEIGKIAAGAPPKATGGKAPTTAEILRKPLGDPSLKSSMGDGMRSFTSMTLDEPKAAAPAGKPKVKVGGEVSKAEAKELEKLLSLPPDLVRAHFEKLTSAKQTALIEAAEAGLPEGNALTRQLTMLGLEPVGEEYMKELATLSSDELVSWWMQNPQSVRDAATEFQPGRPVPELAGLNERLFQSAPVDQQVALTVRHKLNFADPMQAARMLDYMSDTQIREYAGSVSTIWKISDQLKTAVASGEIPSWKVADAEAMIKRLNEVGLEWSREKTTEKREAAYDASMKLLETGGKNGGPMTADEVAKRIGKDFTTEGAVQMLRLLAERGQAGKGTYEAVLQGLQKHLDFKIPGGVTSEMRSVMNAVANMSGPAAVRLKSDMVLWGNRCINEAMKRPRARDGYGELNAGRMAELMSDVIRSDPTKVMSRLEMDSTLQHEIPGLLKNLLQHDKGKPSGNDLVGEVIAGLATQAAAQSMDDPAKIRSYANQYGQFLSHVETAINGAFGDEKARIENGAAILRFAKNVLGKSMSALGVPEAVGGKITGALESGISYLENKEIKDSKAKWDRFQQGLYQVVDAAFKARADPEGQRADAAANGTDTTGYLDQVTNFDEKFKAGLDSGREMTKNRGG